MPRLMRKVNYKILGAFENLIRKRKPNTAFKQLQEVKKNKFQVQQTEDGLVLYPLWHFGANWVGEFKAIGKISKSTLDKTAIRRCNNPVPSMLF